MSSIDLDAAVNDGILSKEQADLLKARDETPAAKDEPIVVTNRFSEIFIAIGMAIVLWGAGFVLRGTSIAFASLLQVVIAWGFAEIFHRRRMDFIAGAAILLAAYFASWTWWTMSGDPTASRSANAVAREGLLLKCLLSSALILGLGIARFRIAFLVFPLGILLAWAALSLTGRSAASEWHYLLPLGAVGVAFLGTAVWLDRLDPNREGKPSQFAFWLFIVGSPLAVHPFFITVIRNSPQSKAVLLTIALAALAVTCFGLVMNRRPPVVSTMIYVTFLVAYFLRDFGATLVAVGAYVMVLGVFWDRIRGALLSVIRRASATPA